MLQPARSGGFRGLLQGLESFRQSAKLTIQVTVRGPRLPGPYMKGGVSLFDAGFDGPL